MHRILIADPLDATGLEALRASGADLHLLTDDERPRLPELIADVDALVVRSMTRVTAELLRAGRRLKVVARAGIGVDNIDVAAATELGILVVNAPTANLLSATEHTFALLLGLARNIAGADRSLKAGEWNRKKFVGTELHGKTLGIIGFGRIGQKVAARARAFEMEVVAFDPFLDAEAARRFDVQLLRLPELLSRAEIVTLHVPLTDQTRNLLGEREIRQMKQGALVVNCARGGVVDEAALLAALEDGHLAGAALDVFLQEPPHDFTLARHPRVVATPHIGAQTHEAQERISVQTARMLLDALDGSLAVAAVNLPFAATGTRGLPYLHLGEQLGRLAAGLVGGSPRQIEVELWGVDDALRAPVTVAVVKGALTPFLGDAVNYVNAERMASGRGIRVLRSGHDESGEYPHLVRVTVAGEGGGADLAGTVVAEREPRVVQFGDYRLEFRPEGRLLIVRNRDVPGVVGKLGTLLGEGGVNIAEIHLARQEGTAEIDAMAVLRLDQAPQPGVLGQLEALPEVASVRFVELGSR